MALNRKTATLHAASRGKKARPVNNPLTLPRFLAELWGRWDEIPEEHKTALRVIAEHALEHRRHTAMQAKLKLVDGPRRRRAARAPQTENRP